MPESAFSRTARLLGQAALRRLGESRVAVFGIGGVGSFTAEALARAGVGRLTLIDADRVCVTNINRQLIALHSTVGRLKAEVMAERIRDINPAAEVTALPIFYGRETADAVDLRAFDYVADAIDTVDTKVELIVRARQADVPIISCMGAGNKLDPMRFEVARLSETSVCPLCKVMRRRLKEHGVEDLRVVYSREPPLAPATEETMCRSAPGSVSFVPSVAGLILAGEIVKALTREGGEPSRAP
ncbi:MAG: tRNA threonylcarbamoyladenosine dehydratase [Kiritimatiellaeota bacterium]|nr:tRNA threonylcarbamoyladenosine dehydratase [Kiritimatiellota bacterium]